MINQSIPIVEFPMVRDSATFRENGTTGQAQNLAMGRDGTAYQNPWDGTWDGTGQSLFFCQNPGLETGTGLRI